MCGIAGWVSKTRCESSFDDLKMMTDMIRHRGPNAVGFYEDQVAHLGHRRLSIIDVEGGHQPLANEDESVWVVFNGEIYDFVDIRKELIRKGHRFKTQSDTEVIVHLYEQYGDRFVEFLRGQFAIAIWDKKKEKLLLCRDRFGQKPLYYFHDNDQLFFGSELKALLSHPSVPKKVDPQSLAIYLKYRYVPAPYSIYQHILKLPPATLLTFTGSKVFTQVYWKLDYQKKLDVNQGDALDLIDSELATATKIRMVSDVPIGAFLSGGIDSSLVVGHMQRVSGRPIKTFSIGFESQAHDERRYARQVANKFGTEHCEFVVKPDAIKIIPELVSAFDEPFSDSSAIGVYHISQVAKDHVTVALNGDGGDESFAGYDRYGGLTKFQSYRSMPKIIRKFAKLVADGLKKRNWNSRFFNRIADWDDYVSLDNGSLYEHCLSMKPERLDGIFGNKLNGELDTGFHLIGDAFDDCDSDDLIDRVMHADKKTYLEGDLLVKADRMTMWHSLEGRSPFLDHKLVEVATSIRGSIKYPRHKQKILLKKLLERDFPKDFVYRKKKGFAVPVDQWMMGDLKPLMTDVVYSSKLVSDGFVNGNSIARIYEGHIGGSDNSKTDLWMFLMGELWYRENF